MNVFGSEHDNWADIRSSSNSHSSTEVNGVATPEIPNTRLEEPLFHSGTLNGTNNMLFDNYVSANSEQNIWGNNITTTEGSQLVLEGNNLDYLTAHALNILSEDSERFSAQTSSATVGRDSRQRGQGQNESRGNGTEAEAGTEIETEISEWLKQARKSYNPLGNDIITIEEIPEREGLLFKHINYRIGHLVDLPNAELVRDRSVVRRYSDFDWLQEVLIKRYPFRMIPELPPKKIGSSQNLDATFLKRRLNGLRTFINLVMKHPVLKEDDLVLTFLTVPADLVSWRKKMNNKLDTMDEFHDKKISRNFVKSWRPEFSQQLNEAFSTVDAMIELWNKLIHIIKRVEWELRQRVKENNAMVNLVGELQKFNSVMYPIEFDLCNNNNIPEINNNLTMINEHLGKLSRTNEEATLKYTSDLIPQFKVYIDILISLRNLFQRYRMLAANNIPQLQKHMQSSLERLEAMKGKADTNGAEFEKLKQSIRNDQTSIVKQLNRSWLIRQSILYEFGLFQQSQFMVSTAFKNWVKLRAEHTELCMNEWENVRTKITDIPDFF